MANNSQSRQPAASRPPLGTRRRRSDYEMPSGHDMSRYIVRDNDWVRHHVNAVYDMPNHSVMPSYYAHQDDGGRFVSMQHDDSYYSHEGYWGGQHVNAPYDHQLPSGSSFAAVGVGVGRPQISLPPDDCSTLFVEGLPADCTRREVSHIFRPFLGFKDVRLVRRESRQPGGEPLTLCFAKFLSPASAAAAMEHLQGYKFDLYENNSAHLRLQFSRNRDGRPGSGHSANH